MTMRFTRHLVQFVLAAALAGCSAEGSGTSEVPSSTASSTEVSHTTPPAPCANDPTTSTNTCPFRSVTATTATSTATLTATGPNDEFVLVYSGENYTSGTELYTSAPLTTWHGRCSTVTYGDSLFHDLNFNCVEGYNDSISLGGFHNHTSCPPPGADRRIGELHAVFEVSEVGGQRIVKAGFPEPRTVFFPFYFPHVGKTPFVGI